MEHHTSKEVAREKLEERLGQLLVQYGGREEDFESEWLGDTMRFNGKALGFRVEGTIEITDAEVIVDGKLPLIANMFEGRIRQAVEREADAMFRTA
ncbi:MAG TPA: polyhydroxyalkanoic acid system family protein [Thermoanaerobaculia bacterium]|nr:polyhydroxyalkanoic acid system family protein [Thermoanaerobaculia bacterium]